MRDKFTDTHFMPLRINLRCNKKVKEMIKELLDAKKFYMESESHVIRCAVIEFYQKRFPNKKKDFSSENAKATD